MFKITGYIKREGEFDGHAYSKYAFEFIHNENPNVVGWSTSYRGIRQLSVSASKLKAVIGFDTPDAILNKDVNVSFAPGFGGKTVVDKIVILGTSKQLILDYHLNFILSINF